MTLFIIKGLTKGINIKTIWKGVTPFIVADILRLAVLFAFPMLTLYLTLELR